MEKAKKVLSTALDCCIIAAAVVIIFAKNIGVGVVKAIVNGAKDSILETKELFAVKECSEESI